MVQEKYTIKEQKHLTSIERGKLEVYFKLAYSKSKIIQVN